jgi:hypothetical protein
MDEEYIYIYIYILMRIKTNSHEEKSIHTKNESTKRITNRNTKNIST